MQLCQELKNENISTEDNETLSGDQNPLQLFPSSLPLSPVLSSNPDLCFQLPGKYSASSQPSYLLFLFQLLGDFLSLILL